MRLRYLLGALAVLVLARAATGAAGLTSPVTVSQTIAFAVPIALAGLAGIWSERSGVVNIGLEGMMIVGTFAAGWAGWLAGPWAAIAAGMAAGALAGLILAVLVVQCDVDHVVAGTAVNLLAMGSTSYLATVVFAGELGGSQTQSPPMTASLPAVQIASVAQPLADAHRDGVPGVRDLAGMAAGLFLDTSVVALATVILFAATAFALWRTRTGLRLRSAGENPWAAAAVGVQVRALRYLAVCASGALAGLGGAYLTVMSTMYREGITAGRGYIGLATTIFGNWRPGGTAVGAVMFGYLDTLRLTDIDGSTLRALVLVAAVLCAAAVIVARRRWLPIAAALAIATLYATVSTFPPEVAQAAPYVVTIVVLAVSSQRLRPPASAGLPYRSRR